MTNKQLTYSDLDVNIKDVYELMGYGDSIPEKAICDELDSMIKEVEQWLRPQFTFTVFRGDLMLESNQLAISSSVFNCGRIVSRQLRGSEAYALFICTAGNEFQQFFDKMMSEGDMFRVYIAHSLGSVLAERCADAMERCLQESINKLNWKRTNRFSPGYCGWHVREQQMLFPLFNGNTSGVTLTESSLMMPIKSVSGVIGLGPDVRYLEYTCGLCDYKDCYKRRKK